MLSRLFAESTRRSFLNPNSSPDVVNVTRQYKPMTNSLETIWPARAWSPPSCSTGNPFVLCLSLNTHTWCHGSNYYHITYPRPAARLTLRRSTQYLESFFFRVSSCEVRIFEFSMFFPRSVRRVTTFFQFVWSSVVYLCPSSLPACPNLSSTTLHATLNVDPPAPCVRSFTSRPASAATRYAAASGIGTGGSEKDA